MYTISTLMEAIENEFVSSEMVYFHGWDHFLSQHYLSPFVVEGVKFLTAEHWMMTRKALMFRDTRSYKEIMATLSPAYAKKLGRLVRGFDPKRWDKVKVDVVFAGNLHKFSQNPELRERLVATGNKILVEAMHNDTIWAVGLRETDLRIRDPKQWRGKNLLGFVLMEVRERLRVQKRVAKKVVAQSEVRKVVKKVIRND